MSIPIIVGDAIEVLEELAEKANRRNFQSLDSPRTQNGYCSSVVDSTSDKFDAVMVDLDSSDAITGVCAPPLDFVNKHVLLTVRSLLNDHGILVVNVVPPTGLFYETLKRDFREVFPELYEIDVGNGENYVLIAAASLIPPSTSDHEDNFLKKLRLVVSGAYLDCIEKLQVQ